MPNPAMAKKSEDYRYWKRNCRDFADKNAVIMVTTHRGIFSLGGVRQLWSRMAMRQYETGSERYHVSVIALDQTLSRFWAFVISRGLQMADLSLYDKWLQGILQLRFPMKMIKSQRLWLLLVSTLWLRMLFGLSQRLSGPGFPRMMHGYTKHMRATWFWRAGGVTLGQASRVYIPIVDSMLSAGYLLRTSPIAWAVGLEFFVYVLLHG